MDQDTRELREKINILQNRIKSSQGTICSLELLGQLISSLNPSSFKRKSTLIDLSKHNQLILADSEAIKQLPVTNHYNQKQHIQQSLTTSEIKTIKTKIDLSRQKLANLYSKINIYLQKEQPYIHQKIMARIKNQVESFGRKKLLERIREEVKKRGKWRDEVVSKSMKESGMDVVRQQIAQNISLLKQIRERKVLENDIIFTEVNNLKKMQERIKSIPEISEKLAQQIEARIRHSKLDQEISPVTIPQGRCKISAVNQQLSQLNQPEIWENNINVKSLTLAYSKIDSRLNSLRALLNDS